MFSSKSRNSKIIVASLVLATLLGFAQIGLTNNSQLTAIAGGYYNDYNASLNYCQGDTSSRSLTLRSSVGNQINVVGASLPNGMYFSSDQYSPSVSGSTTVNFVPNYSLVQNVGMVQGYYNFSIQQYNRYGKVGSKLNVGLSISINNCYGNSNSSSSSSSSSISSRNFYSSSIPTFSSSVETSVGKSSVLSSSSKVNSSSNSTNSSYIVPTSSAIFNSSKAASSMVYNSSKTNSSIVSSQNYFSSAVPVSSQTTFYRSSSSSVSSLAKYTLGSNIGYVSGEPSSQLPSFYLPGSNVPNGTDAKFTPFNSTSITGRIYYSTFYADYGQVIPNNVTQGNSYATVSVIDGTSITPVRVSTFFTKSTPAKVVDTIQNDSAKGTTVRY